MNAKGVEYSSSYQYTMDSEELIGSNPGDDAPMFTQQELFIMSCISATTSAIVVALFM